MMYFLYPPHIGPVDEQLQVKVHQFYIVHVEKLPGIHLFFGKYDEREGPPGPPGCMKSRLLQVFTFFIMHMYHISS